MTPKNQPRATSRRATKSTGFSCQPIIEWLERSLAANNAALASRFLTDRNEDGSLERRRPLRRRHQRGYVYDKDHVWFVRYYDDVPRPDGSVERKTLAKRLGTKAEYPRKRDALRAAEQFLAPLNAGNLHATGALAIESFVDTIYLPHVADQCRPSTYNGYRDMWRRYVKPRCHRIRLREFQTWHGEMLLQEVARHFSLSRTTLKHIKAFISGIFKYAKRQGFISGANPMQDVSIPQGRSPRETYAYTLEDLIGILQALPLELAAIVTTAAFTGVRRGELAGLRWEDYNGAEMCIVRSVWRGWVTEPKTEKSKAPIPVITPLAMALDQYRAARGNPSSGYMFATRNAKPMNMADAARHKIRPLLKKAGIKWYGWNAFRRGLATNLYRLGVPDKAIQRILRHSNVSTTMAHYIKTVSSDAVEAMQKLESAVNTIYAPPELQAETRKK